MVVVDVDVETVIGGVYTPVTVVVSETVDVSSSTSIMFSVRNGKVVVSVTTGTRMVVALLDDIGGWTFSEQAELSTVRSKVCSGPGVVLFDGTGARFSFLMRRSGTGGVGSNVTVVTVDEIVSTWVSTSVSVTVGVIVTVVVKKSTVAVPL